MDNIKTMIGEVFNEVADAIMTGNFGSKVKVGLTTMGSEQSWQPKSIMISKLYSLGPRLILPLE